MCKHILVFGAGKSATCLISYLLSRCATKQWRLTVADHDIFLARSKVGNTPYAEATQVQVEDQEQRSSLVKEADLVISLLPPSLHFLVAGDCLMYGKDLLTASYLDEKMLTLAPDIKNKGLLFICEMGLDPGIDHMSAMRLVHQIKHRGGQVISFKSHCGGLVAPESDDNPWHYKISWNPNNIVRAGSSGAVFLENNQVKELPYEQLFANCEMINVKDVGELAYYPNRDSMAYRKLYELENTASFVRTTLRHPHYCLAWNGLVNAGLTNDIDKINSSGLSFSKWSESLLPFVNKHTKPLYEYLGVFGNLAVPENLQTSAAILQYLLEERLMMKVTDKDMIVMLHEISFYLNGSVHKTNSLLMLKGNDNLNTAMAKTVGLPLGIAAVLVLEGKIQATGLHIPVIPEIYEPVLNELQAEGIAFEENEEMIS